MTEEFARETEELLVRLCRVLIAINKSDGCDEITMDVEAIIKSDTPDHSRDC